MNAEKSARDINQVLRMYNMWILEQFRCDWSIKPDSSLNETDQTFSALRLQHLIFHYLRSIE